MSDLDDYKADAEYEEELILQANYQVEEFDTELAKRLQRNAKINEQPPSVQKYWLGRLAYELAIRNSEVKTIIKNSEKLSPSKDYYSKYQLSEQEKYRILHLDPYGFSAQPESNVLATQHTTFPPRLIQCKYGYIEINTIKKIEKLLSILDDKTAKELNMNTKNHQTWLRIGQAYVTSYLDLILLDADFEFKENDYQPPKKSIPSNDEWTL